MGRNRTRSVPLRLLAAGGLALLAAAASLCLGAVSVSPGELLEVLLGNGGGTARSILLLVRAPRTLGCLLAGAALAASGAIIQTVMSNPLAAPNIIGVNSGAGFFVAACSALLPAGLAVKLSPLAAFLGAFSCVMLVLLIAEKAGSSRIVLVLAGVAISGMFGAGTDTVVTLVPDALTGYSDFRIGGLANVTMEQVAPAMWVILLCLAGMLLLSNELDVLTLGSDTAQSLGLPVKRIRVLALAAAAALAGAAVSFSGLLGFVGLIVPHMVRRLIGSEARNLLLGCALGGAALLTLCDIAARLLFAPYELPVGIVLSFAGGALLPVAAHSEKGASDVIALKDLTVGYHGEALLSQVNLEFPQGQVTVLLGPNGCGKSTLLRTVLGLLPPLSGEIFYDGEPISSLSGGAVARKAAYMAQNHTVPSIVAQRMVLHGRFPYLSFPRKYRKEDHEAVRRALETAGGLDLSNRPMQELSGGQRQKVYLAMALAQETGTILMDEPTTWLDIRHQLEVMATARALAESGRAVGLVSHDLCLALRTADRVAVLAQGALQMAAPPEEAFASGVLDLAFGVQVRRVETPTGWQYYCE